MTAALSWDREGPGGDRFCGENVHRRQEAQTRGLGSRTEDNTWCSILSPEQGARRRAGEGAHARRDGDRAKARQLFPYFAWLGPVLLSPKWSVLEPSHCPPSHRWASSGISMTGRPESSEGPEALGCARNEPPAWSSSPQAVLCTTRKVLEGDLTMCVLPNVVPYKPNANSIHPFENQFQNCRHKMHFPM